MGRRGNLVHCGFDAVADPVHRQRKWACCGSRDQREMGSGGRCCGRGRIDGQRRTCGGVEVARLLPRLAAEGVMEVGR